MALLSNIPCARFAEFHSYAFGFVNVAAEEVSGLAGPDKIAHGGRAGVEAFANTIERGTEGRGVTDQHEGVEFGEALQAFGKLRFAVFSRRVERRGTGIAEAGDLPSSDLQVALMKMMKAVPRAHAGNLVG